MIADLQMIANCVAMYCTPLLLLSGAFTLYCLSIELFFSLDHRQRMGGSQTSTPFLSWHRGSNWVMLLSPMTKDKGTGKAKSGFHWLA